MTVGTPLDKAKGAMEIANSTAPTIRAAISITNADRRRLRIMQLAGEIQTACLDATPEDFRQKFYEASCEAMKTLWSEAVSEEREACAALCEAQGDAKVAKWSGTELETTAKADAWNLAVMATTIRTRCA